MRTTAFEGLPRLAATWSAIALIAASAAISACGGGTEPIKAKLDEKTEQHTIAGFPALATKNTTRVAGENAIADAAGVARAVYPGQAPAQRPAAVALVDKDNWQAGVAASVLMAPPVGAPVLLTDGDDVPQATSSAIDSLGPTGFRKEAVQAFAIGGVDVPSNLKSLPVRQGDQYTVATQIDRLRTSIAGKPASSVIVASGEQAAFAMPAAAYAARSGVPVLFATRDTLPAPTRAAIRRHRKPAIYVLGPESAISAKVFRQLRRLGPAVRVGGASAVANAVAFARYSDGSFGWGVNDPGHGLTFANTSRPLDAAASAALAAKGAFAPLLLIDSATTMPKVLEDYLLDIQPGYRFDPVRGVYNHAWLLGDESAISLGLQGRIDQLAEIVKIREQEPPPASAPATTTPGPTKTTPTTKSP
ncbi:MAG: cell wall-binding repeat-containing protein [Solirubrobacterales bacterium]